MEAMAAARDAAMAAAEAKRKAAAGTALDEESLVQFSLTPRSPSYYTGQGDQASVSIHGADFYSGTFDNFALLHSANEVLFSFPHGTEPSLDLTDYMIRDAQARYVLLNCDLCDYAPDQQLNLTFHTRCASPHARVLVYSDAEQVGDWTLTQGTKNFHIHIESLESPFLLYFIHGGHPDYPRGGNWRFRGITGSVGV
jgi:hypothetical protein